MEDKVRGVFFDWLTYQMENSAPFIRPNDPPVFPTGIICARSFVAYFQLFAILGVPIRVALILC